jgi:hypothetical protein
LSVSVEVSTQINFICKIWEQKQTTKQRSQETTDKSNSPLYVFYRTPTNNWFTAAFAEDRLLDKYRRYDCPSGFMPGQKCGYGPMEQEWAQQREWMHPLPSWSVERGWTAMQQQATKLNRTIERKWNSFVTTLEDVLIDIRAPEVPSVDGMSLITAPTSIYTCGGVSVKFDARGAVIHLVDQFNRTWANSSRPLGLLRYSTYSTDDFKKFDQEWNNHGGDFEKPGMDVADAESKNWDFQVLSGFSTVQQSQCRFIFQVRTFASGNSLCPNCSKLALIPSLLWANFFFPLQNAEFIWPCELFLLHRWNQPMQLHMNFTVHQKPFGLNTMFLVRNN